MFATAIGANLPRIVRLERYHRLNLRQDPFLLSTEQSRGIVRDAIAEASEFRRWSLSALHVRTNHVHGIVFASDPATRVFGTWKAYATRRLRQEAVVSKNRIIWTHGASVHNLADEHALSLAIRYVLDQQGKPLAIYADRADYSPHA